ncbi:MAG: uracil-DNA glycosylase [Gammaproteobacteria bacterium]
MQSEEEFNPLCRDCPRLAGFLDDVKRQYPDYHARPVAPFGVDDPKLLVVGLAPGMHGANATGRPFTGDYAGLLLYPALYRFGFSNRPDAVSCNDGLELIDCRITNAVKCLPPQNKPTGDEIRECNRYLAAETDRLSAGSVILALGGIAHRAVLRAIGLKANAARFIHGAAYPIPGERLLINSYHCSRYNVNTGRLTPEMFETVFRNIAELTGRRSAAGKN